MSSGEMCVLLVYRYFKIFKSNIDLQNFLYAPRSITITQCQEKFAGCVVVKFEF